MSLSPWRALPALLLLLGTALPGRAAHGFEDDAHLFSYETREKVSDAIDEIYHRTGKDLFIQTVNRLSPEELKQYRSLKAESDSDQFFRQLAEQRARHSGVNGVYVLLCRVPAVGEPRPGLFRSLHDILNGLLPPQVVGRAIIVSPASAEPYFPKEDQVELSKMLKEVRVGDHKQNEAILKAVTFAGERLEQHARELGAPPPDTFRWTSVLWAAVVVAGVWGLVSVARDRVAARQGTPGPVPGAQQALAAQYGTAGMLWLAQAYLARRQEAAPPPVPQPELPTETEVVPDDGLHPDDRAALARGTRAWDHKDAEASAGHDAI